MKPSLHPDSDIQSKKIGSGTSIWQYCVVLEDAQIGSECNICSHCFIENDVVIGDRVTVKCGVQLWDGLRVEDDVFIGPNVTFTNDLYPRSKQFPGEFLKTVLRQGVSIGANATILPGIEIGSGAMVGAGSVVTSNVPPGTLVVGNPARIVRYLDTKAASKSSITEKEEDLIAGAEFFELTNVTDVRGQLTVVDWSEHLPFTPARSFFVHSVPSDKVRGEHAHIVCEQALVCISGSVNVLIDSGNHRQEVLLDSPSRGIYIPAGLWAVQYRYSPDAVLAVFASHPYDEADYIRNYDDYLERCQAGSHSQSIQ